MNKWEKEDSLGSVAIIGMVGRFPGAENVDEFWHNLHNSVESVSFFADEELVAEGIDSANLNDSNYVKAASVLSDVDLFDASFFNFPPYEAEITDPQHRLFLEYAWGALESAGYNSETYEGRIGVYAGAGLNSYLLHNLNSSPETSNFADIYRLLIGNDKDFVATRVSFHLNLTGPSVNVSTACSTSLVAVQMGCQSLLNYQSDMVLAGGVSVRSPQKAGYLYQEGMILSPDGHCRAFDAQAQGTIGGSGVGIVVLKRLEDALADGDCIHAIIKGSAINNDGAAKVGYTAPSIDGQAEVILEAQALAGIDPETITYVEAHGTGTSLGDPIEIAALTQAFSTSTQKKGFCGIGSVKTNVGHLDAAAGVTGLIKTVLALKNRKIPPSLHFQEPNPKIDFASSPFYVNTKLKPWETNGTPRRAGVSSFGVGGTNAHVVLEEAPPVEASGPSRPWQLLLLSAKTSSALETATENLVHHLHGELNLADVAYTLSVGRRAFNHRRFVVSQGIEEAKTALSRDDSGQVLSHLQESGACPVVFMFSGQGAQYVNMAQELYLCEATFTEQVDICCELLKPHLGFDLRQVLYPTPEQLALANEQLQQTAITQPVLFVIEYALAQLWQAWGVCPKVMLGHSIGEYVAATLAEVWSLEDALALVAARGKLMQGLPSGSMLAVPLAEEEVFPLLSKELSVAVINGPFACVVSGTTEAVEALESQLASQGIEGRRLHTSHGFHSPMMEPIVEAFTERVKQVRLSAPQIPYLSNVTGTWITPEEATSPAYWAKHLRQPVRWASGLEALLQESSQVLLEIGPGRSLMSLAKRHPDKQAEQVVLSSVKHPQESGSDVAFLLKTLGQLWLAGVDIDWCRYYAHEQRHRLPLPTYPFERQRYWISPPKLEETVRSKAKEISKLSDISKWFYMPSWKRLPLPAIPPGKTLDNILLFVDECDLGKNLAIELAKLSQKVICVKVGDSFMEQSEGVYTLNPQNSDEYKTLFNKLDAAGYFPNTIIHLWNVTLDSCMELTLEKLDNSQDLGLHSLIFLAQALGKYNLVNKLQVVVVSNNLQDVMGDEVVSPEKATLLGAVKTIPLEYSNVHCRSVDVIISDGEINPSIKGNSKVIEQLLSELMVEPSDNVIAYRGAHRWKQTFEQIQLDKSSKITPRLKANGVYLITGGFGGIGFTIAQYLAESIKAKIVLLGRSKFLPRKNWETWLANHDEEDLIFNKIRKVQSLEELGAEVLVISADVSDYQQVQTALTNVQEYFGDIDGVFHAAGMVDYEGIIQNRTKEMTEGVLSPKVKGTLVLDRLLDDFELDFFILFSSLGNILYQIKFGQVGYNAANEFLDSFVYYKQRISRRSKFTVTINWDDWEEVGMSVNLKSKEKYSVYQEHMSTVSSISPPKGIEILQRVLDTSSPLLSRVIISTQDLDQTIKVMSQAVEMLFQKTIEVQKYPRPQLSNDYIAPRNETEQKLADVWQNLLGIEHIGINDNFFELGGDSLLGVRIISELNKVFNLNFSATKIYESPNINSMAKALLPEEPEKTVTLERRLARGQRRRHRKRLK
ncbi:MAG: SDR family oxidoreductase [Leptolyngbya sp. SIO1E4]|nr:SDR family oxidoreductase [Leptolyngbya sp. SIO1E4]